ncbi:MAG: dihydrolipoamide acetyltransferase family protein [Myxococcota bacterium]
MANIVEMPRLSDTMREGTIGAWHVEVGAKVSTGEALADIETDKASMTFESFDDGVMLARLVEEGDTVPLGTPICVLGKKGEDVAALVEELKAKVAAAKAGGAAEPPDDAADDAPDDADDAPDDADDAPNDAGADASPDADTAPHEAVATASKTQAAPEKSPTPEAKPAAAAKPKSAPKSAGGPVPEAPSDEDGVRVRASPLARRLAAERGVDLLTVHGSGPHGRIVAADVEDQPPGWRMRTGAAPASAPREDQTIRVTQMRKTIARRLVESKQSAPHFYLTSTWRADKLVDLRAELNSAQDTVKVSLNDLIMRAVVLALNAHPDVNAGWEDKVIRQFGPVHLGFAVALPTGLITPVVRDAQRMDVVSLALAVRELAERARAGSLDEADYTGNSFCVSNLGMFGIEHFTAIINPPAACILAVGAVRDAPVVDAGTVRAGKLVSCTLSCDHRVVDGAMGAAFMQTLGTFIETPLRLVL